MTGSGPLRALDLGCKHRLLSLLLAEPGQQGTGLDFVQEMLVLPKG